jgi:hypothetical protein
MSRMVGGTFGVAVLGTFISQTTTPHEFVDSLGHGLLLGAIVAAIGAIVSWALISPELAGGQVRDAPPAGEVAAPAAQPARGAPAP